MKEQVLLIEDNPGWIDRFTRLVIESEHIDKNRFEWTAALNCKTALYFFDKLINERRSLINTIFMDYELPEYNGHELYKKMLELDEEIARQRVVLWTTLTKDKAREAFEEQKAEFPSVYINKGVLPYAINIINDRKRTMWDFMLGR